MSTPNIVGVLARVCVDDLEAAIPVYQGLAEVAEVNRFTFRDVELAQVGPFSLLSSNSGTYRDRVATILVRRLAALLAAVERAGGQALEGPSREKVGMRVRLDERGEEEVALEIEDHPLGARGEIPRSYAADPPAFERHVGDAPVREPRSPQERAHADGGTRWRDDLRG